MCRECGNCSRQHTRTIDDSMDETIDSLFKKTGIEQ
jgi:hypothetical protein